MIRQTRVINIANMKIIKHEDYVDRLHAEFPLVNLTSIKSVIKHGTNMMLHYRKANIDMFLRDDVNLKFYVYLGEISNDPVKRNAIYFKKKHKKLRHMYRLDKRQYDGYYYFSLNREQQERYEQGLEIDKVYYYKVEEETHIRPGISHVYRVKTEFSNRWVYKHENHLPLNAELHTIRKGTEFEKVN